MPRRRQRSPSPRCPAEVRIRSRVCASSGSARMALASSNPSRSGICASRMARSNGVPALAARRSAARPASARDTSCTATPSAPSMSRRMRRLVSLSSTTRSRRPPSDSARPGAAASAAGTSVGRVSAKLNSLPRPGALAVTSEPGGGSEFSFTLTLPTEVPAAEAAAPGRAESLGGRRLLVVDDNETNRRILRDMLGAEGVAVQEVSRADAGLAALRRAASAGTPLDLAILDAQMPERDGFELARAIRADPELAQTRLLILTSAGQRGDGERCRRLGIQAYLTKPIARADLIEAVGTVLAGAVSTRGVAELVTRHSIAESRHTLRILLAEDNPVNQQVATAMLLKRGHHVDVVSNGREAVDAVRTERYHVVLMDIQMPEMDGFAATEEIRALPQGRTLPIIALTAHALSGERERCLQRGMTGYLAKPFKAHELFAVVEGRSPDGEPAAATPHPVDVDAFRRTMQEAGAAEAVDGILATFVQTLPQRLDALAAATRGAAAEPIQRAAHAFKSAAATIGARTLATLLEEMEAAARDGNVAGARDRLARVRAEAQATLDYLRIATEGGQHA